MLHAQKIFQVFLIVFVAVESFFFSIFRAAAGSIDNMKLSKHVIVIVQPVPWIIFPIFWLKLSIYLSILINVQVRFLCTFQWKNVITFRKMPCFCEIRMMVMTTTTATTTTAWWKYVVYESACMSYLDFSHENHMHGWMGICVCGWEGVRSDVISHVWRNEMRQCECVHLWIPETAFSIYYASHVQKIYCDQKWCCFFTRQPHHVCIGEQCVCFCPCV